VLEVVCLTCADRTREPLQAPLLLALLLQRADPALRTAFLNSADGVRLLVALQQTSQQMDAITAGRTTANSWCIYDYSGAMSGHYHSSSQPKWHALAPAVTRAIFTLAWCFLDPEPGAGAATAAAAAAGSSAKGGGGQPAALVTEEAVASGSVLLCAAKDNWEGEWL
jgi:hypothetical protein